MSEYEIKHEGGFLVLKCRGSKLEIGLRDSDGVRYVLAKHPNTIGVMVTLAADQQFALAAELLQMDAKELARILGVGESLTQAVATAYNEGFDAGKKDASAADGKAYDDGFKAATVNTVNTIKRSNALFQIRDLLFPTLYLATKADLTTDDGRNAVVDAVRVLKDEAGRHGLRINGLQTDNNYVKAQRDAQTKRAALAEDRAARAEKELKALKGELEAQYLRGYRAALRDVRKASLKLQDDGDDGVAEREGGVE